MAGCSVSGSVAAQRVDQKTVTGFGLAPLVVIDTFNGRITVTAGGDGVIEARVTSRGSGTSQADAEEDLRNVQVTFDQADQRVTITARRTDVPAILGNSGADMEVSVPTASSLELRTSNGRIEAANVAGSILAKTSNGAITTRGGNDLDLDTSNGPVSVNNASGTLVLRTSNGTLDVLAARNALVSAQTSNAGLSFNGSLFPGTQTFETSNGDLTLTLPGDSAFTIDGSTSNGSVRTDFPLELTRTTINGTAGVSAVTTIRAATSNGDLSVMSIRP
jgi:DUF4097 and DUF4098 domain-containing protein YvlB